MADKVAENQPLSKSGEISRWLMERQRL